jgi:hypothetical protein
MNCHLHVIICRLLSLHSRFRRPTLKAIECRRRKDLSPLSQKHAVCIPFLVLKLTREGCLGTVILESAYHERYAQCVLTVS